MKLLFPVMILTVALLSACVSGQPPQSIGTSPLLHVAAIDEPGLFAADSNGHKVAIRKDGLSLFDLGSGSGKKLSPLNPLALAWSPDGETLVAAYAIADYETKLSCYSAEGVVLREISLPVALTQIVWSTRGDLLATGFVLKVYSFGGNLKQSLYLINEGNVEEIVLTDTTLRPSLVTRLVENMRSLQPVAFSPHGDELVFLFLHDPPEFPPYLQLIYRNWMSAEERVFQRMPLQTVELEWLPSGDFIEISSPEGSELFELWPPSVNHSAPSNRDMYRFIEGRLYQGAEVVADWGEGAQLQMLANGLFLVAVNKSLYLGEGLQKTPAPIYDETGWNLRRWRYDKLITPSEYHKRQQENDQ